MSQICGPHSSLRRTPVVATSLRCSPRSALRAWASAITYKRGPGLTLGMAARTDPACVIRSTSRDRNKAFTLSDLGEVFTFRMTCGNSGWLDGCPQVKRALPTLSGDFGSGSAGRRLARRSQRGQRRRRRRPGLEPGEQFAEPPVVVDPGRVVAVLARR